MSVQAPPRARRRSRARSRRRGPEWWWGEGPPPHERWPGVTLPFDATWSTLRRRWETHEGRYFFDADEGDRAVRFFPLYLTHHIGEFSGQPFELRDDQDLLIIRPTFGWKRTSDGTRRFRKVFAFCPKGYGKALALDTPIPTVQGWTTMGEIAIGTQVFDERGRVCDVLAVSEVMTDRRCYRVTFDDGSALVADADHLWFTEQRRGPRFGVRTTEAIRASLRNSNGRYQSANHSVPLAGPLGCRAADLPIDPYVLGVWLGDGDEDSARVTLGETKAEVVAELAARRGVSARSHPRSRYGLSEAASAVSLQGRLRGLNVLGDKHIPPIYLRAAVDQRLALLQGLMDTDGYISPATGTCEFCTTDARLAAGMAELLVSLGIKVRPHESAAKLYGREVSRRWRFMFHPPPDLPVFRLPRKARHHIQRHARRRLAGDRRIVAVDPVPSVPVRCLRVSSPSQLFLAGRSMVPTHNSPLGAGLGIYLARCDREAAAEVYAVAADRDQARTVHDNAKIMVVGSPDLYDGCEVLRDSIVWAGTHSVYKVLSSDSATKHGFRPHGVVFDELHAQRNRDLFETLVRSMVKRRQPLLFIITHAGMDEQGICYEEYDLAKRILQGHVPLEQTLPVIFEAQPGEDWTDPKLWKRVNPGHGHTVKADQVALECEEAQVEPRKRNDFLRYHLNRWTSQATAWIPIEWWDVCRDETFTDELAGLECAAGLDLAQKWDLAAFVAIWRRYLPSAAAEVLTIYDAAPSGEAVTKPISLNYELFVKAWFWIPENTMRQHEKEDGVAYSLWRDDPACALTATEGDVIDYSRIYQDITTKIVPRFPGLKQATIGYDPAFATDLASKLRDPGGLQATEVLQNYAHLSEPSQVVEALLKGARVHQDGNPLLRWCWENVVVKRDDARRIKPVKPTNAAKRVDGAVATIIAVKALAATPPPKQFQTFAFGGS